jgi:hypothetical protein
MNQYPISAIIPTLDREKNVVIPLSWKMGPNTINTCFKLTKEESKELGERLIRLAEAE